MDEIKQFSAIIPMEEYELLKSLRVDKDSFKKEIIEEITKALIPYSGTHQHINNEEHNFKGLGFFGGYLFLLGATITMFFGGVFWAWYILIGIGFLVITSIATGAY